MRIPRPRLRSLRLRTALLISLAAGLFFAVSTVFSIGLLPPHFQHRNITVAGAAAHVVFDAPDSLIGSTASKGYDGDTFTKRAELYANIIASPPVRDTIARRVGVDNTQLATRVRLTLPVMWAMRDPDAEQRANQILLAKRPYKLELQSDPTRPVLNLYAQAPSVAEAKKLADTAVSSLRDYLRERAISQGSDPTKLVRVEQLGPARGGVLNAQILPQMVLVTFMVAFGVSLALLMGLKRVAMGITAPPRAPSPNRALVQVGRRRPGPGGDWPHTTRLQPWLIAGLMGMLWLVPFNAIQLSISLPFDAKLDRLVLPALFGLWLLTLAVGGPTAPRWRPTLIHVGIAGFVIATGLSVVDNTLDLNQTLEFDLAFKKLTLLGSYVLMFVIIASTVRRNEVRSYLKLNLVLAVMCAAGVIWEYRFHYNVFYNVSAMLLPGLFSVGQAAVDARDDIGRVMTFGPTDHPLEVAGMLTMALPIALVGILDSKERRKQIYYGIAACILLAGAISTYRKSALLGPVFVVLTIAYFRRRELLRLAPLGFVAIAAIHALAPGAFGSIVFQLHPSALGVATVSDRAADYDAVRPDVWSHLIFGRGYGTYDHLNYRILDSEMLSRLVDTGVVGVFALVFMIFAIVIAARRTINARHPEWSAPALAVVSSAVAFLVFTFLFDVTSFPHVPYILLALAGLLAVVLADDADEPPLRRAVADHPVRQHVSSSPRAQQRLREPAAR